MKQSELIILAEKTAKEVLSGEPGTLEPNLLLKFTELLCKEIRLQSFLKILASVKQKRNSVVISTEDEFSVANSL